MSTFLSVYALAGWLIILFMLVLWLVSLLLRNSSIVDIFWGAGFVLVCWFYFLMTPEGYLGRKWLIATIVTIWGLRLSLHILRRNWRKGEDYRYRVWRDEAGASWWWRSLFKVFLLQGLLMWIISTPLLAAQFYSQPNKISPLDVTGLLVWAIGFFFEAVGDWQLARFRANPANRDKVLNTGLWRFTRHPNYFGDATQWWGFYLIALATLRGFWTVFSPILMTGLLMRVSGVVLLEKTLVREKPGYRDYVESTNAFFPWFPKKKRPV